MSRLARPLILILLAALVGGCAAFNDRIGRMGLPKLGVPGVYRATIQQGNVITQEMVDRLKPGMTQRQVRFILGEPILGNAFRDQRWDYVYTVQAGSRPRQQQRLTVWFDDVGLTRFEGDFVPSAIKEAQEQARQAAEEAAEDAAQG
ncbi:MAG TPA: outer membrane protein assembly factor BamE [Pseudomonadales bacterium]|nr:outer membrane protein assembly factor BamE [Pseudomonadales bacterium]